MVLWGKLAELAQQYLAKGRQVYIEGRRSRFIKALLAAEALIGDEPEPGAHEPMNKYLDRPASVCWHAFVCQFAGSRTKLAGVSTMYRGIPIQISEQSVLAGVCKGYDATSDYGLAKLTLYG